MTTTRKNQEDFCSPFQSLFCSRCKCQQAKFCVNYKMANSVITYFMPFLMATYVIGNSSPARNHPESASPRTLTLDPAILSLKASLSKLRITPTPPALKHEKPSVYDTNFILQYVCNMVPKCQKLVKNPAKPFFSVFKTRKFASKLTIMTYKRFAQI